MKLEKRFKHLQIALKIADWFSTEEHIDYDVDFASECLFIDGKMTFFDSTILEFTESITPDRFRYRYQYMHADGSLIFRYDNVPHHREIATFPHHKHIHDQVVESHIISLRQVIEEIVELLTVS